MLMARVYREGLGVPKNLVKAQEFETLAPKQTVRRFTFSADFGGVKAPFNFYAEEWPLDFPFEGIDDQIKWLKEARSGVVAPEVGEAFRKVMRLARQRKVSFPDLCVSTSDGSPITKIKPEP
jgi:Domain of unknown function (DUF2610)